MPKEGPLHPYRRRGALALAVPLVVAACSDTLSDPIIPGFYATLSGDQIVAAAGGPGTGTVNFVTGADSGLTVAGGVFSNLAGTPTKIAIYVGGQTVNGTERADICGGVAPACAAAQATGLTSGTPVVMRAGFTKGQLYTALHTYGNGYVQINTVAITTGEIRGVLVFNPLR